MENKNEGVYLWMLDQDRQKNQRYTKDQGKTREPQVNLPNIPEYLLQGNREIIKVENDLESDNNIDEIDQLLREKEALEEESKRLDEEKNELMLRAKSLLEKEIQDLRNNNSQKQLDLNRIKTKLNNLKTQPP